jgi:hypothetical protein
MVTPAGIEPKRISQTQLVVWSAILRTEDPTDARIVRDTHRLAALLAYMNASISENPGKSVTFPQCGHRALATSGVDSISSSVRCKSAVRIVRTTASIRFR